MKMPPEQGCGGMISWHTPKVVGALGTCARACIVDGQLHGTHQCCCDVGMAQRKWGLRCVEGSLKGMSVPVAVLPPVPSQMPGSVPAVTEERVHLAKTLQQCQRPWHSSSNTCTRR